MRLGRAGLLAVCLVSWPGAALAGGGSRVDHQPFDLLLHEHVRGDQVDYEAFARAPEMREYLAGLAVADVGGLPEAERLALWINAYNAYTIRLVNEHGIPDSIREITAPGRDGSQGTAWQTPVARVAGRTYTLDEIEHEIIRPTFNEPRIHFALICAARGCPPLRAEAYAGGLLDEQLEDQAMRFLHGKAKGCRVDPSQATVYVSEIFDWYREDFGGDDAAIGRYIARYLPPSLERQVLESGRFRLRTLPFDWRLNGVAGAP